MLEIFAPDDVAVIALDALLQMVPCAASAHALPHIFALPLAPLLGLRVLLNHASIPACLRAGGFVMYPRSHGRVF